MPELCVYVESYTGRYIQSITVVTSHIMKHPACNLEGILLR